MFKTRENFKEAVRQWINDQVEDTGVDNTGYELDYIKMGDETTIKEVDSTGGENEGSNLTITYEVSNGDHTVYVQFSGWYQSYEGGEYEEWDFVEPKKKEVTVYE